MKRLVMYTFVLFLIIGLNACASTEKKTYVIGISQPFMGHPIRKAGQILIDAWAAEHPEVTIYVTDGQLNAQKQIADIEDLMAKEVDILLVAAHQSATLVGVLREVKGAGIPIIPFDRVLTDASVQIGSVINDEFTGGQMCGELVIQAIGSGDIAVLEGPAGNTGAILRNNGFLDAIKGTGINIVSSQVANFQRVQAVDVFENILQANPQIKAVFAHNDEMALGVVQVLEAAGRTDILVIGYDGQKDAMEAVIAGKMYGTVRKVIEFPKALDMALEYLKTGKIVDQNVFLAPLKITKDNVEEYYDPEAVF